MQLAEESSISGPVMCNFDMLSGEFAWLNESTQMLNKSDNKALSQLYKKKTRASCTELGAFD